MVDQAGQIGPSSKPGLFRYSDTDSGNAGGNRRPKFSGEPVDEFIRRRIIEPLGMKDTFCVLGNDSPPRSRVSSNHAGPPEMWHKYWDREAKPFFPFFLGRHRAFIPPRPIPAIPQLLARSRKGGWATAALGRPRSERAVEPFRPNAGSGSNTPFLTGLSPLKPFYGQHWMVYRPRNVTDAKAISVFGTAVATGTLALVFPERDLIVCYFRSRGGTSNFRFEELIALFGRARSSRKASPAIDCRTSTLTR